MADLLTRAEKLAWRNAVDAPPAKMLKSRADLQRKVEITDSSREAAQHQVHAVERPREYSFQAAS
jgi:hypothetical protein